MLTVDQRSAQSLIGKELRGRYRLLELLGEGGMGAVYRAEHVHLETTRAIKLLLPCHASDHSLIKRFHREARGLSRLDHPNVVSVVDTGETEDGLPFIAMEYLEGEPLRTTIRREKLLPWSVVKHIARQVCNALHAAHEAGLIHRDVKPDNCFRVFDVTDEYRIKLLDFGIAKQTDQTSHLTETGSVMGTLPYMSCEQIRGDDCDRQTDIWSAAAMFYEMLTGKLPFGGSNPGQVAYAIVQHEPKPLTDLCPELPTELNAIFACALAKDKAARFPTMLAFLDALERVSDTVPTISATAPTAEVSELTLSDEQTHPWPGSMQSEHLEDVDEQLKSDITLDKKTPLPTPPPRDRRIVPLFISLGLMIPVGIWLALQMGSRESQEPSEVEPPSVPTLALAAAPAQPDADPSASSTLTDTSGRSPIVDDPQPSEPFKPYEGSDSGTTSNVEELSDKASTPPPPTSEPDPKPNTKKAKKKPVTPHRKEVAAKQTTCVALNRSTSIDRCLRDCTSCSFPVQVVARESSLSIIGPFKSATTTGGKSITECLNSSIQSLPPPTFGGICKLTK